jgi:hypothetical protein
MSWMGDELLQRYSERLHDMPCDVAVSYEISWRGVRSPAETNGVSTPRRLTGIKDAQVRLTTAESS